MHDGFEKYVHNFSDSQHSRGTSILFRKRLDIEIINVHKSNDGRLLLLNLIFKDNKFSIMNIYAPNSPAERKSFFIPHATSCGGYNVFDPSVSPVFLVKVRQT